MLIKKTCQILFLTAGILGIAACSTTTSNGDDSAAGGKGFAGSDSSGATASGAGDVSTFSGPGVTGLDDDKQLMRVGDQHYYFDFNRDDVKDKYVKSLKIQADFLIAHPKYKVRLEGNTDERGSREYNIGLGERRAQAVAKALLIDGVSKNQITTISYGAEKPVALGHTEDDYAKNRRVDLVYQPKVDSDK